MNIINVDEMIRNKCEFIKRLELALLYDYPNNQLTSIDYRYDPLSEVSPEIIIIRYEGGGEHTINVHGNSNAANAKEIIGAVYYGSATGLMPGYKSKKEDSNGR